MSVIIGSARIDSKGHAHGDEAGDQKQTGTPDFRGEVSMQEVGDNYFSHHYIYRPKSAEHAIGFAKEMETACNNPNIGYDQWQRYGLVGKPDVNTKKKVEVDCSSLVREIITDVTGIDPGDLRTVDEPKMLDATGLFKERIKFTPGTTLYTGDIFVTTTSGHTGIVVKGADRGSKIAKPTLKFGSKDEGKGGNKGIEVTKLQKNLNSLGIKDDSGKKLEVDGDFGPRTEQAVKRFQKAYKLEIDGIYGPKSYAAMKKAIK